jgi:hypothetical protein
VSSERATNLVALRQSEGRLPGSVCHQHVSGNQTCLVADLHKWLQLICEPFKFAFQKCHKPAGNVRTVCSICKAGSGIVRGKGVRLYHVITYTHAKCCSISRQLNSTLSPPETFARRLTMFQPPIVVNSGIFKRARLREEDNTYTVQG